MIIKHMLNYIPTVLNYIYTVLKAIFEHPRTASILNALQVARSISQEIRQAPEPVVEPSGRKKVEVKALAGKNQMVLAPSFKMVFITVVMITVLTGAAELFLASVWTNPTRNQQTAFEAMGFAWKSGIGAIFGLLGGKLT